MNGSFNSNGFATDNDQCIKFGLFIANQKPNRAAMASWVSRMYGKDDDDEDQGRLEREGADNSENPTALHSSREQQQYTPRALPRPTYDPPQTSGSMPRGSKPPSVPRSLNRSTGQDPRRNHEPEAYDDFEYPREPRSMPRASKPPSTSRSLNRPMAQDTRRYRESEVYDDFKYPRDERSGSMPRSAQPPSTALSLNRPMRQDPQQNTEQEADNDFEHPPDESDDKETMFWGGRSFTITSLDRSRTTNASSIYEKLLSERGRSDVEWEDKQGSMLINRYAKDSVEVYEDTNGSGSHGTSRTISFYSEDRDTSSSVNSRRSSAATRPKQRQEDSKKSQRRYQGESEASSNIRPNNESSLQSSTNAIGGTSRNTLSRRYSAGREKEDQPHPSTRSDLDEDDGHGYMRFYQSPDVDFAEVDGKYKVQSLPRRKPSQRRMAREQEGGQYTGRGETATKYVEHDGSRSVENPKSPDRFRKGEDLDMSNRFDGRVDSSEMVYFTPVTVQGSRVAICNDRGTYSIGSKR
ncbi:hypothetical protein BJ742DRAFT_743069 [Cladochytrium replicatum]|nr:hypothetical protein BJ742DRAFT_743069 [Cladochytrium replicatum]